MRAMALRVQTLGGGDAGVGGCSYRYCRSGPTIMTGIAAPGRPPDRPSIVEDLGIGWRLQPLRRSVAIMLEYRVGPRAIAVHAYTPSYGGTLLGCRSLPSSRSFWLVRAVNLIAIRLSRLPAAIQLIDIDQGRFQRETEGLRIYRRRRHGR